MARLAFARAASSAEDGGLLFLFILRRLQRKTFRLSEQYMLKEQQLQGSTKQVTSLWVQT